MMWILGLFLSIGFAIALECKISNFYTGPEVGFYVKKLCEEEKKEEKRKEEKSKEKLPQRVKIPWDMIDKLTPKEIRELHEKVLEIAVMYPTYENVYELKKLEAYMLKKAQKFYEMSYLVAFSSPEIAKELSPTNTQGRMLLSQYLEKKLKEKLLEYKDRAGLVVVESHSCPYCIEMKKVLEVYVKPEIGYAIRYVNFYSPLAKRLGAIAVPDIFLVIRKRDNTPWIIRVATGFVSADTLLQRIYYAILYFEKEVENEKIASAWR